ncbi:hypothetical protein RhiirA1_478044 [Rhizophagus irregularis]|uniref:Uncharacterized protein n=1 Tax=Rhizophagus irregularis TaxID=588596 RepID=A0A2N0QSP7_9GLOM|nr:hypothetical protein RhiirA1_478044 [Rhizophagus irregularis]GBC35800.2 hypothetical protein GLOIN_2v1511347 [Rhizophagus irregularis DAOM 181602=DAOM 197198]
MASQNNLGSMYILRYIYSFTKRYIQKSCNIKIGYTQVNQAFNEDYFDYLYGIMTMETEWHFIIYTSDGIYCTSESKYQINLLKSTIKNNPELL